MAGTVRQLAMIFSIAICHQATLAAERPIRTAQLISMLPASPRFNASGALVEALGSPHGTEAADGGHFARDRVEAAMRASLADRLAPSSTSTDPSVLLLKYDIPNWMLSGIAPPGSADHFIPRCSGIPYRPSGMLRVKEEARREGLYAIMSAIACEHGIPVGLFDALIMRESRYDAAAVSPKLAYGFTQLMPGTARELGVDRYNPIANLRGGARYLRAQLDRFGQYHLALAAYNAGPGRIRKGKVPAIAETQAYVQHILATWSRMSNANRMASVRSFDQRRRKSAALDSKGRAVNVLSF